MAPLIVLCGPTASGKSAVAIRLCKLIGGEVVSCDSMQLYRGMDIGTATPTRDEMDGVRHHLLSVIEPTTPFSAAAYRDMARPVIEDIRARGRVPVLCGGTGLYINALTRPLSFAKPGDDALRARLMAVARQPDGKHILHEQLRAVDEQSALKLHENDVRRVIRALEVYTLTGRTLTEQAALDRTRAGDYDGRLFALDWPRDVLYARIDERVEAMMRKGLLHEVRALLNGGVPEDATSMQAIGYKELACALGGRLSIDQAIDMIKQNTRRYAKRQLTWFRGDERTQWIRAQGRGADDIAREILDRLEGET